MNMPHACAAGVRPRLAWGADGDPGQTRGGLLQACERAVASGKRLRGEHTQLLGGSAGHPAATARQGTDVCVEHLADEGGIALRRRRRQIHRDNPRGAIGMALVLGFPEVLLRPVFANKEGHARHVRRLHEGQRKGNGDLGAVGLPGQSLKVEGGKGRQASAFEFVDVGAGIVPDEHQHGKAVARPQRRAGYDHQN